MIPAKNCERFEILLYLHVNKFACHGFMNSGIRHEIPGSELRVVVIIILLYGHYYYHSAVPVARVLACMSVSNALILIDDTSRGK